MIQDTWKAVVSAGRIRGAPNRASLYPHRLSNSLPRNPLTCLLPLQEDPWRRHNPQMRNRWAMIWLLACLKRAAYLVPVEQ